MFVVECHDYVEVLNLVKIKLFFIKVIEIFCGYTAQVLDVAQVFIMQPMHQVAT